MASTIVLHNVKASSAFVAVCGSRPTQRHEDVVVVVVWVAASRAWSLSRKERRDDGRGVVVVVVFVASWFDIIMVKEERMRKERLVRAMTKLEKDPPPKDPMLLDLISLWDP